jgi:vancomycin resistance protein YoaR
VGVGARHADLVTIVRDAVLTPNGPVRGLRVAGRLLASGENEALAAERCARVVENTRVRLIPAGSAHSIDTTLRALGVHVDVEAIVRRASAVGRRGPLAVRIAERVAAARGDIDVPFDVIIDTDAAESVLLALKEDTDARPTAARYDFTTRRVVPHRTGSALDVDRALTSIRAAAATCNDVTSSPQIVELPRTAVLPTVTEHAVSELRPSATIAEYATGFGWLGKEAPRARNIEVAAARLDGVVLVPNEVVSFNAIVGPRTVENGFQHAFQIYKGEMIEGVGGGTCQVSSTLHAAAVYAGLDIVERAPHSRPLGYVPLGLDSVDLKIRNPWAFPIVIHTHTGPGSIVVQLLGERRPALVVLSRETLRVEPFTRKVEVHPELPSGRYLKKQKGISGYDVRITRRTTTPDGESHVIVSIDRYPATPELFWIAPGLDREHTLPPLPDGAVPEEPIGLDAKASPNPGNAS